MAIEPHPETARNDPSSRRPLTVNAARTVFAMATVVDTCPVVIAAPVLVSRPLFDGRVRETGARGTQPELVTQIDFTEWTHGENPTAAYERGARRSIVSACPPLN